MAFIQEKSKSIDFAREWLKQINLGLLTAIGLHFEYNEFGRST